VGGRKIGLERVKRPLYSTQFTNIQVTSFGFPIKPSSHLFIFQSNAQYPTLQWADDPDSAHTPTSIHECLCNIYLYRHGNTK
jgi:hypothetical protein